MNRRDFLKTASVAAFVNLEDIVGIMHTLYMWKDSNIGYVLKGPKSGYYVALTEDATKEQLKALDEQVNPSLQGDFVGEGNNKYLVTNRIISRTGDIIFDSKIDPNDYDKRKLPLNKTEKQLEEKYTKVYGKFINNFTSFERVDLETGKVIEILPINQKEGTTDAIYAKAKAFTDFLKTYRKKVIGIEYCRVGNAVKDVFYPDKEKEKSIVDKFSKAYRIRFLERQKPA